MYPLDEMDYDYIVESIKSNKYLTKEYKEMLIFKIKELDSYNNEWLETTIN